MAFKSKNKSGKGKTKSKLIKVGALWENNSGNGYSGQLDQGELEKALEKYGDSARICLFENSYKEEDKHPDLVLYVGEGQTKTKSKPKKRKESDDSDDDSDSDDEEDPGPDDDDAPID